MAATTNKRRVLLLTPRLLDDAGGRASTDLALRLDRERFEPVVCCYEGWGPLAEDLDRAGIEIFPHRKRRGFDWRYMYSLAREMRRRRIDVVHTLHATRAYVVGVVSGVLAGVRAGVATFREPPREDSLVLRGLGRLCGEVVGRVSATSPEVAAALLSERWVPPGKTTLIPDGVNLERFADRGRRGPARAHWGIPEDAPLVGAVLLSHAREEIELVRDAFQALREKMPEAWLVCCGIRGEVDHGRGLGPFTDSPAFYAAIDALCVPFATRTVPLTLLEGLAAGVPIAASRRVADEGHAPEGPWAFANVTDPGERALADGLHELLTRPSSAEPLVREGRACVEEGFSIEANVAAVQRLYE